MFNFVVLAHEEGVSTGTEAWLGPTLFFLIVLSSIFLGRILVRRRSDISKEVRQKND